MPLISLLSLSPTAFLSSLPFSLPSPWDHSAVSLRNFGMHMSLQFILVLSLCPFEQSLIESDVFKRLEHDDGQSVIQIKMI